MTMTLTVPQRAQSERLDGLPVVVIGAGPVGLAAAAHLVERHLDVVLLEAGEMAGFGVASWGHVRLFSPWSELVDAASVRLLAAHGWCEPEPARIPLGSELVKDYLRPLASTPELAPIIRYSHRVLSISRQGMDKTRSQGRAGVPFVITIDTPAGVQSLLARAVIDASGTLGQANSVLSSGIAEHERGDWLVGGLPDVLGLDRERFAGKHVAVVGAGHSAANTLLALARLATDAPATRITWIVRNSRPTRLFGSGSDELEARGHLGERAEQVVRRGLVDLVDGYEIDDVRWDGGVVVMTGRRADKPWQVRADIVVNATGFRPDLGMLRELRLSLDEVVEAPRHLAPLIDPNLHSCGTVPPHGVVELTQPEPNFFIAGMKSYGRAPTFLMMTGYEQVRSIAAELAGDRAAAREVRLVLPETGVCSSDLGETSACCA